MPGVVAVSALVTLAIEVLHAHPRHQLASLLLAVSFGYPATWYAFAGAYVLAAAAAWRLTNA